MSNGKALLIAAFPLEAYLSAAVGSLSSGSSASYGSSANTKRLASSTFSLPTGSRLIESATRRLRRHVRGRVPGEHDPRA